MFRLRIILFTIVLWLPVANAAGENTHEPPPLVVTRGAKTPDHPHGECTPNAVPAETKSIYAYRIRKVLKFFHVYINEAARAEGIDCKVVAALIATEVGGEGNKEQMIRAVSKRGARGLMQVMPDTAKERGVRKDELFDPRKNVRVGTEYFVSNIPENASSVRAGLVYALLAYNRGPRNAQKLEKRGADPFTFEYIQEVRNHAIVLGYVL